ncbi:hypothetical protein [Bowmanella denitrificans]|uniref:hypothetical protein n=1 Tax=Bowmanella denitrificans TaxID=366582 RepID=UPI000C99B98C|nr:hypothetical protein [Bowmanella denitrificans]
MQAKQEIQALLTELYQLISGPAGYQRNWQRQQQLFMPYAKMIRTTADEQGHPQAMVMAIEDYPANVTQLLAGRAFFEVEIHNIVETFGNIAHAFSSYEAWEDKEKTVFIKRGINSIQLFNTGSGWKIVNMLWDDERPGLSMPDKYKAAL